MINVIEVHQRGRTVHPDAFRMQAFGVVAWGILFVGGVLGGALVWGAHYAYYTGLVAAGAAYVCFAAQIVDSKSLAFAAMVVSVFAAAFAALLLMQGN